MAIKINSPREKIESFAVGDTVCAVVKIHEDEKARQQQFEGIVIAVKGKGVSRTFTVRKIARGGVGVERIFPLQSPNIEAVSVVKKGRVRRSKLYYLRSLR